MNKIKHVLHSCFLLILIYKMAYDSFREHRNHTTDFGYFGTVFCFMLNLLNLSFLIICFPAIIFTLLGFLYFNAFPGNVKLKTSLTSLPCICFRIVTRGDYPELVWNNVLHNLNICLNVGLQDFIIQVVTNKEMELPQHKNIKQTVVPNTYTTKSGALFRARNLQYCLEDGVNELKDSDFIVHLDEETLITENSVRGIANFISTKKYHCGQGVTTYTNIIVTNWITTLLDNILVSTSAATFRFVFEIFHRPLLGWKGVFQVINVKTARDVSFDHGIEGSILEDMFFCMNAYRKGYKFHFVEGDTWEQSPTTLKDHILQRKRWIHGHWIVSHNKSIPLKYKFLLLCTTYMWVFSPYLTISTIFIKMFKIPCWPSVSFLLSFTRAIIIYSYIYPVLRSFNLRQHGLFKFCLILIGSICVIPINEFCITCAVILKFVFPDNNYYIVKKLLHKSVT